MIGCDANDVEPGKSVVFVVVDGRPLDNGKGMQMEIHRNIFEGFLEYYAFSLIQCATFFATNYPVTHV